MSEIRLPKMGMQTVEVDVTRVLVSAGDRVEAGRVLFEVESEKVEMEITADDGGTVTEVLVAEGDIIEPGAVLARLQPSVVD